MQNKLLIVFVAGLMLSGCTRMQLEKTGNDDVTPDKIIATRGGPDVGTLESALLESAKETTARGEYRKAAEIYLQLTQRAPDNDVYQLAYAESLRRSGQFQEALKAFEGVIKDHPDSLVAHEGRGLTLLAMGQVEESIKVLTPVLQRDSTRWRAANGIAIALSIQKNYDQAVYYYRAALQHSDNNPSILNNLGLTLAIQKDYDKAVKALELAQRYVDKANNEDVKRIATNLSMVYALSGDMTKAEDTVRPYMTEAELYNAMGHFAAMAHDDDLAKTYLDMALSSSKKYYGTAWKNLEELEAGGH